jgi:hypothetical protein
MHGENDTYKKFMIAETNLAMTLQYGQSVDTAPEVSAVNVSCRPASPGAA